jgi:hypothetical protein
MRLVAGLMATQWVRLLAVLMAALLLQPPALVEASCGQFNMAANIARADVIAYGRVSDVTEGLTETKVTVDLIRLYKGTTHNPVQVKLAYGKTYRTSIDYVMEMGTDHTLYLSRTEPINRCDGSHPGPLLPEERSGLGAGAPPPPAATQRPGVINATTVAFGVILLGAAGFILWRRTGQKRL